MSDTSKTLQSWLYYREVGAALPSIDPVINRMRSLQKAYFSKFVSVVADDKPTDKNQTESVKEILEKRMLTVTPSPSRVIVNAHPYRRAIANGVWAGILVMLLVGTAFLVKTLQ